MGIGTSGIVGAIGRRHPVMGSILDPANPGDGHTVMITGYNNTGTIEYFDPQTGNIIQIQQVRLFYCMKSLLLSLKTMKAIKFIIYISTIFPLFAIAQNAQQVNRVYWAIEGKNNEKDILTKDLIIDMYQINNLKVLTTEQINKRYHDLNSNIVLLVTLKPAANIVRLTEFYSNHKINQESQKLPISVNGSKIIDCSKAIIDENSIKSVIIGYDSLRIITHSDTKN